MISGAGPAGISTWLHLHKYAPRLAEHSLVIDKAVFPRHKVCAGGVGAWSPEIFARLEIDFDIPSLFVSSVEFRYGNETYTLYQPNSFRIVQRIEFDHDLLKIALARGLEFHEGEAFIDAISERGGLVVRTSRGEYRVKALVGADGALSSVRRKMMPPTKPHLATTLQVCAEANSRFDTEFDEEKIVLDLTPIQQGLQGYVWHVPCVREGVPSIAHGIGDFRIYPDRPRVNMKDILLRELRSRGIHPSSRCWSGSPIRWASGEDTVSRPNVLLVGDAAGIEPAFGGGIHISLSYGEVASKAIADAFEANDFSFDDYDQRIACHRIGGFMLECTGRALQMYGGSMHPLRVARELFSGRNRRPDLLLLLLTGNSRQDTTGSPRLY